MLKGKTSVSLTDVGEQLRWSPVYLAHAGTPILTAGTPVHTAGRHSGPHSEQSFQSKQLEPGLHSWLVTQST